MADLPQYLIEEMLPKLPVKSLLRFKSVSKKWYSLISQDHEFAKSSAHTNRVFFQNHEDKAVFESFDIDTCVSRKINFPPNILATPCCVVGSANGLICVATMSMGLCYIWNPCSNNRKPIPLASNSEVLFGFGYDSYSDDYKIVGSDARDNVNIFSLRTNSWKILENSGINLCFERVLLASKAVLFNGALHWYAGHTQSKIIAFDLAKDKSFTMNEPQKISIKKICSYGWSWVPMFEYQGSLCICDGESIWAMKEYGVEESRTKLATISETNLEKPIGISKAGKVEFHEYDKQCRPYSWSYQFDNARAFRYTDALKLR